MPKPDLDVVRDVIAADERGAKIYCAIEDAWNHCAERYSDERATWRRSSTHRAVVWEAANQGLIDFFSDDRSVQICPHHDTLSYIIDGTVLLRIKHAGIDLRTANYPTQMACDFHRHTVDMFGFEGLHRVHAVYVLNKMGTAIEWIGIVARDQDEVIWPLELVPQQAEIHEFQPSLPYGAGSAADHMLHVNVEGVRRSREGSS